MNSSRNSKRPRGRFGHGTIIAYVALFFALGGSGWAATHIAGRAPATGHLASAHGRRGPRGPRGPRGFPGKNGTNGTNGASGPTQISEPPAYTFLPGATQTIDYTPNPLGEQANDAAQGAEGANFTKAAITGVSTYQMQLLTPSQLSGSTGHLMSVNICYGSLALFATSATMTISNVTVDELQESGAMFSSSSVPTPTTVSLLNTTTNLVNGSGCTTFSPSAPAKISPSGYLELRLGISFSGQPNGQALLWLGDVTTTYSP